MAIARAFSPAMAINIKTTDVAMNVITVSTPTQFFTTISAATYFNHHQSLNANVFGPVIIAVADVLMNAARTVVWVVVVPAIK